MKRTTTLFLALSAAAALAQQPTPKTSEQQARTYIASAFMTGAAPLILSDDVVVQPELRQRLALPQDANGRTVYQALVNLTLGKLLQVRPAIRDEVLKSQAIATPGKAIFALEAGDTTLVLQYDLERDNISFVGQPAQIATAEPVTPPTTVRQVPDTQPPVTQAPAPETPPAAAPAPEPAPLAAPAPAPAVEATPPAEPAKPALQVVEPQEPRMAWEQRWRLTSRRTTRVSTSSTRTTTATFRAPRRRRTPTSPSASRKPTRTATASSRAPNIWR